MAKILLVDDDEDLLRLCESALVGSGHEVVRAMDGDEALTLAASQPFDLVITDVIMPRMNGWNLVRHLRARSQTAFTPVIFLSALQGESDRLKGFRLGADHYLPKPFPPEDLVRRVDSMFNPTRVRRRARVTLSGGDLTGRLEEFGITSLLVMLEMERKNGVLRIDNGGRRCEIWLREGRIVKARLGEMTGQDAIYDAIGWSTGRFGLRVEEVTCEDEVRATTTHLLMNAAQAMDEASRN